MPSMNLSTALRAVPQTDKIIFLGDFNAQVGSNTSVWTEAIGLQGIGKMNANRLSLLSLCVEHQFVITNTIITNTSVLGCICALR